MDRVYTYAVSWDAPFDRIEIRFNFVRGYPATGPTYDSGGEPGAPDDVEVLSAVAIIGGEREELSPRLTRAFGKLFDDDLIATAREDDAEARSYSRRAA